MPPIQDIMSQIVSRTSNAHVSKRTLSSRQIQSHICYIQRSLNLTTGFKGEWTSQASEMLNKWLSSPKKGTKAAAPLAIADGDVNEKLDTEEDTTDLLAENPDFEVEAKDPEDKEADNTQETQAEDVVETKEHDAGSDSDSSHSSSSSSSWTLPTDWGSWTSEWHDVWQEALYLPERSAGESQEKADIAMTMLRAVHRAKLQWDRAN
ncbi:unnamed protein product [Symbiodinium microadriaticum]|nr:unnamed protein product [Symbiodinium microadriaticum]